MNNSHTMITLLSQLHSLSSCLKLLLRFSRVYKQVFRCSLSCCFPVSGIFDQFMCAFLCLIKYLPVSSLLIPPPPCNCCNKVFIVSEYARVLRLPFSLSRGVIEEPCIITRIHSSSGLTCCLMCYNMLQYVIIRLDCITEDSLYLYLCCKIVVFCHIWIHLQHEHI